MSEQPGYTQEVIDLRHKLDARGVFMIVIGGNKGTMLSCSMQPEDMPGLIMSLRAFLDDLKDPESKFVASVKAAGQPERLP